MNYYEVSPVGIVRADSNTLTYASFEEVPIGSIVEIEVGKKTRAGIVISPINQPSYQTKQVGRLIEQKPLPTPLIDLALWLAKYYATHLGTVWQTVLPRGVQKTRRAQAKQTPVTPQRHSKITSLTSHQQAAIDTINGQTAGTILLHGVTGSGKTQVYIESAKSAIERGESVIVLTPEIGLTSQLVDDFSHHFDSIILTHSKQTEAERHIAWQQALNSTTPSIIIGPRSALFMPLAKIGLIIIDEAHEPSYKQESSPRYHALRAAKVLADKHLSRLVLGSATPLVADYYAALQGNGTVVKMPIPAQAVAKPTIKLIDMKNKNSFTKHRFLSDELIDDINATVSSKRQVLIFHNRRGSASVTLCTNCSWQAGCPNCFIPLTLHADRFELLCHICNFKSKVPITCPVCHSADIVHKGIGTKIIEDEIAKQFPNVSIARFDGDVTKDNTLQARYNDIYTGKISIIIGTQVIAKGLDLPHLGMVGIIQADAGLSLPDFGSSERAFQLITQALGRVGRNATDTRAIVQSYQPDHPAVTHGLNQNYADFFNFTLKERRRATFPPFTFLLKLTCIYKTEAVAIKNSRQLANTLRSQLPQSVTVFGPTPAFYERQRDTFRWQLILKSNRRQDLVNALSHVPTSHWQSELDPMSLL